MPITIPEAVKQLLAIVDQLRVTYEAKRKRFTLDGLPTSSPRARAHAAR